MNLRGLLKFSLILEFVVGIGLLIVPNLILEIVFGKGVNEMSAAAGRWSSIMLLCLVIACWQFKDPGKSISHPANSMFIFNLLAALFFAYFFFFTNLVGVFMLPALILHAIITILFFYFMKKEKLITVETKKYKLELKEVTDKE